MTTAMVVASEILRQLGGARRLATMIGARAFVGGERVLQFKFSARARNGANTVRVELAWDDTYTVSFWSVRGSSLKLKSTHERIYCDMLVGLVERETGLCLSLGTLGGRA